MKTQLPPYALFAGKDDAPAGGWNDFVMYGSLDECKGRLDTWHDDIGRGDPGFNWAHIVDLEEAKIAYVATGGGNDIFVEWMPVD